MVWDQVSGGWRWDRRVPLAKYNGFVGFKDSPFFSGLEYLTYAHPDRGPKMGPSPLTVLFKCLPIHQDGTSMMTTTWWWCNFQKGTQIQSGWAKKNQKAITCKNYDYSNNKHNSRLIDPGFKVQIGYLTVNRQTNKQMGGAPQPNAPSQQMVGVSLAPSSFFHFPLLSLFWVCLNVTLANLKWPLIISSSIFCPLFSSWWCRHEHEHWEKYSLNKLMKYFIAKISKYIYHI